jgi:hypothetical protein
VLQLAESARFALEPRERVATDLREARRGEQLDRDARLRELVHGFVDPRARGRVRESQHAITAEQDFGFGLRRRARTAGHRARARLFVCLELGRSHRHSELGEAAPEHGGGSRPLGCRSRNLLQ